MRRLLLILNQKFPFIGVGKMKGSTKKPPTQLFFGLLLFVLFGVLLMTLAGSGSSSYTALVEQKKHDDQLRIASSYLTNKVRQNDVEDCIIVSKNSETGHALLKVLENGADASVVTWIYYHDGYIKEATFVDGAAFDPELGFEIAKLDVFALQRYEDNIICLELGISGYDIRDVWIASKTGYIEEGLQ